LTAVTLGSRHGQGQPAIGGWGSGAIWAKSDRPPPFLAKKVLAVQTNRPRPVASVRTKRSGAPRASMTRRGLLTPEQTVHRFDTRSELIAFTDKREDVDWQLAANLRQLLGFDPVGSDRTVRRKAADWHNLRDVKWVLDTETQLLVPLFGTLDEKHKLMQKHERGIDSGALKKLLNGSRKTPIGKWIWFDHLPPVVDNLSDGASIVGHHLPVAAASTQLPDFAAIGIGSDVPFETARSDPAGALNFTVHRTPLVPLEPCARTREAQLLFDLIPPPCAQTRAICDRALSVHADAGATSAARGARSCSSASGSQEVSQGSNLAFARSCARCCAQISMVPTRSRAPVTRARRSILDLRRWSSMHCRAPRARVPQGVGAKK
jgi:hypothetical protein